jgi:hypothetical protein
MNNLAKHVERMQSLLDIGDGLLHQLYYFRAKIVSNDVYSWVTDSGFSKVRAKLEKKFPLLPDLSKVSAQL